MSMSASEKMLYFALQPLSDLSQLQCPSAQQTRSEDECVQCIYIYIYIEIYRVYIDTLRRVYIDTQIDRHIDT